VIAADLAVPATGNPSLSFDVASDTRGDFVLKVFVQDQLAKEAPIANHGKWETITVDMTPYAGKTVPVRIENHANGWEFEAAYLDQVRLK